ncbi:hypothetical protein ACA910_009249 [Epithemia clementina (nom. ined.)]
MASQTSLDALAKTDEALKEIQLKLRPFLQILAPNSGIHDPNRIALARTAVALSLGTLRYMGNRLRGSSEGKNPKDPLRLELNRMRQILVQVQKKQQPHSAGSSSSSLSLLSPANHTTLNKRKSNEANDGKVSESKRLKS